MKRLQEQLMVDGRNVLVSTNLNVLETMVFFTRADGSIIDIDNPILEKSYTSEQDAEYGHNNLVDMYKWIEYNKKTRENWKGSFCDSIEENSFVSEDIVDEMANCLPPTTYKSNIVQMGEAYDHLGGRARYITFRKKYGFWYYSGLEKAN